MKKLLFLLVLILIAGSLSAAAEPAKQDKPKLIVATDASWPPMESMNSRNEIEGYDIDLMKAVAEKGGFTVEFRNVSWTEIFFGMNKGNFQAVISSVSITPERRREMDFSVPYINAGQVLIVRASTTGIEKLSHLTGKTVGAQVGTTGAAEIAKAKNCTLRTYDEISPALDDLVNGNLDGVIADTPVAANYTLLNPKYKNKLKIAGKHFTSEYYGIAVRKGDRKTLEMIDRGLKIVLADKTFMDMLEKKWLR